MGSKPNQTFPNEQDVRRQFKVSVPLAMNLDPEIAPLTGISPAWVWTVLRKHLLKQKGASLLQGEAPPGDLERQIQVYLDK